MTQDNKPNQPADLDAMVREVRDQAIDPAVVAAAAARVRHTLTATPAESTLKAIASCADFQSLLPAYLSDSLSEARTLLVRDHAGACVPCRRALKALRSGDNGATRIASAPADSLRWLRPVAAAALISVGIASAWVVRELAPQGGTVATVQSADSGLVRISEDGPVAMANNAAVAAGDSLRTGKDSGAFVRMNDGSVIEMAPRTEISLKTRRGGSTVELARGNMIIHAAKQRDGQLYAQTSDCLVSVTGTIFAVSHGTKGSRVSVIEGRVEVDDPNGQHVLGAGDQVASNSNLAPIPVAEDIAWSGRLDEHLAMLRELSVIGREIEASVASPQPRVYGKLMARLPANTVLYAAVPNLSQSLNDAYGLFRDRMASSPALSAWWNETQDGNDAHDIDRLFAQIREFGSYLGDEIVLAAQSDAEGRPSGHLILAEVTNARALRPLIEQRLAELNTGSHGGQLALIADPSALQDQNDDSDRHGLISLDDDVIAFSLRRDTFRGFSAVASAGAPGFAGTPFYERIQSAYRDGVNWIFAADMSSIVAQRLANHDDSKHRALAESGIEDLQYLIIDQRVADGLSHKRATLTFEQARRGIASWLAAPAPMPGLAFLSPDATAVAAFVVKNPAAMLDDIMQMAANIHPDFRAHFDQFESENGVRIRDDFAAPLGGEAILALDGPLLPKPSWKLVFEVYDPSALEHSIEWLVERFNQHVEAEGKELVHLSEDNGGHSFHTLRVTDGGKQHEVHYAFVDGYLIIGPERVVVSRAIRYRDAGQNLATSARLRSLYPNDGYSNFSAIVFHDLQSIVAPLASSLGGADSPLSPEQQAALSEFSTSATPTLFYAYALPDRIEAAGTARAGLFGVDLGTLLNINGLAALADAVQHGGTLNSEDGRDRMLGNHEEGN